MRPYLAHKRTKTFVDHWLLDADLAPYLEPARLARLNAVERALLAQRLAADDRARAPPRRRGRDPAAGSGPRHAADRRAARRLDARRRRAIADGEGRGDGSTAEVDDGRGARGAPMAATRWRRPSARPARPRDPQRAGRAEDAAARRGPSRQEGRRSESRERRRRAPTSTTSAATWRARDEAPRRCSAPPTRRRSGRRTTGGTGRRPQSGAAMIEPNRLWRDLALHPRTARFLSPWLGLATEQLRRGDVRARGDRSAVRRRRARDHAPTARGSTITGGGATRSPDRRSSSTASSSPAAPPLVVGMSYVRTDDRHDWSTASRSTSTSTGRSRPASSTRARSCSRTRRARASGSPRSSRSRAAASPVAGARATQTIDVAARAVRHARPRVLVLLPGAGHVERTSRSTSAAASTIVAAAPGRARSR